MRAIVQRVHSSSVSIDGVLHASINRGMNVLIGYCQGDDTTKNGWLCDKLLGLRIFPDEFGKMNKSILEISGSLLIIPNFTLCADMDRGLRPSFVQAEDPAIAKELFVDFLQTLKSKYHCIESGVFGADMNIHIENDGPVTLIFER